jgi:hypothetical protein
MYRPQSLLSGQFFSPKHLAVAGIISLPLNFYLVYIPLLSAESNFHAVAATFGTCPLPMALILSTLEATP